MHIVRYVDNGLARYDGKEYLKSTWKIQRHGCDRKHEDQRGCHNQDEVAPVQGNRRQLKRQIYFRKGRDRRQWTFAEEVKETCTIRTMCGIKRLTPTR